MVSSPQSKSKSLLFTSPLAGEGKSSTVANLGITLASASLRVVIVDSDLRKPKQASIFGLDGRLGFRGIPRLIEAVLERHAHRPAHELPVVLEADRWARDMAERMLAETAVAGA